MKKIIAIKNQAGQSMIEMVFAITIVALVITGAVVLVVNSVGIKNHSFDRKKAMEMAELVTERLVDQKRNDSVIFWQKNIIVGDTLPDFSGYSYDIGYSGVECNGGTCTMAIVTVKWANGQSLQVNKFFSKEVN